MVIGCRVMLSRFKWGESKRLARFPCSYGFGGAVRLPPLDSNPTHGDVPFSSIQGLTAARE